MLFHRQNQLLLQSLSLDCRRGEEEEGEGVSVFPRRIWIALTEFDMLYFHGIATWIGNG